MPGLLRGVARTAVIAGTATSVSNRVSRRQANRWAAQEEPPPPAYGYEQAPPPPPQQMPADDGPDMVEQLRELGKLRDDGILTEEEFAAEKHKILG